MILSRDRILTTHVGSLPRNEQLSELLLIQEAGGDYDKQEFEREMDAAVRHVVAKQREAGIDIGNDGEQQRVGFQTYVPQRMSGFGGVSKRRRGREFEEFPTLVKYLTHRFPHVSKQQNAPEAQAELHYHDTGAIKGEIKRFQAAAKGAFAESFMTAPSPGIIASTMLNAFYDSHEAYLAAIAREMKEAANPDVRHREEGLPPLRRRITQHISGTDNVKSCANIAVLCGTWSASGRRRQSAPQPEQHRAPATWGPCLTSFRLPAGEQ